MRLFQGMFHPPDLSAPRGDNEIEYTPLELTRLRRSAITFQKFVIAALVLMLAAGGLAVYIGWQGDKKLEQQNDRLERQNTELRHAVADIIRARKEARLNTCRQDYAAAVRARNTAHQQAVGLITIARATATPDKPFNEANGATYIADQDMRAAAANPLRDCSAEGIDDFYTNAPEVPPCAHGGDGKGRCAPAPVQP